MLKAELDVYAENLYADLPAMQADRRMQTPMIERILRVRTIYSYWRQFPAKTPREIVAYDMECNHETGLKKSAAYEDVQLCKQLLGLLNQDTKEWHQWFFNQQIMKIYKKASDAEDYKTAEKALADYAKFNKLDKDDPQKAPDVVPERIIFTSDPRTEGLKPIKDLEGKVAKLEKTLLGDIEDASYEEILQEAKMTGEMKDEAVS